METNSGQGAFLPDSGALKVMRFSQTSSFKISILISALCLVLLFDILFFRVLLWTLPNESSWGSNYFYNFIQEYNSIDTRPKEKFRIILLGSSVAHYSFDRKKLEDEIYRISGKQTEVGILSYAGMAPLDAFLLRKKIVALKPDLVVYPVNFVDWRLHRAYVLEPKTGKNETISEDKLLRDAFDFGDAPQSRFIFPWETFREFWKTLGPERAAEYLAASLFCFYRYKDIYWKNVKSFYEHRFGKNTSYQEYNGVQIPERVTSRGWTGKVFSFEPKQYMARSGFYVQIVEEILRPGNLALEFRNSIGESQTEIFESPGWKKILLKPEFLKAGASPIKATLSASWIPYEAGTEHKEWTRDRLGVRLQQTFGLEEARKDIQFVREERIEDLRYQGLSEKEYEEYFYFRLLSEPEKRPGIQYLRVLADAKKKIAREKFRPVLHFRYLKEFLQFMRESEVPVFLINNPENPISLSWYENSPWYKEYIAYLKSVSSGDKYFLDFGNVLGRTDFWDYHHFTYQAMKRMNSSYAAAILKFVE